ncbi:MAG: hydroxymethylbilane synthase [Desulfobacterales bacterium]|jgi:hydroxymethylbilane synthase|nr:hydroxymethylbilane synthase [Desulfobacterales bacterium]
MGASIRIGTRGSQLALWQANWVKDALIQTHPSLCVALSIIKTKGDKIQDVPLAQIGSSALFVKEIEAALSDGSVDVAVHSMKDMPSQLAEGLCIGAIPEREQAEDVLIAKGGKRFSKLPPGAKIGTSSLRRGAQLLHARPDICLLPIRGNLDTRIRKLDTEDLDAIVVAAAGVKRLNFTHRITEYLDASLMLPAVGQGALCLEIRQNDAASAAVVSVLNHAPTHAVVTAERAFLGQLGGTCQVPLAAHGHIEKDVLRLHGLVAALDGKKILRDQVSGPIDQAEALGIALATQLVARGAHDILKDILSPEQFKALGKRG